MKTQIREMKQYNEKKAISTGQNWDEKFRFVAKCNELH